jgi:hypothetical protein
VGGCFSKQDQVIEVEERAIDYTQIKSFFSYNNLCLELSRTPVIQDKYLMYGASKQGDFFRFGYLESEVIKEVGWKVHISIDDSLQQNIALAWDALSDIIIENRLQVKIIQPNQNLSNDINQHGKQITIYCHMTLNIEWSDILQGIEKRLLMAAIRPGTMASSDKAITNSRFMTYRNDDDGSGNYIQSNDYNPRKAIDPFINLFLEPDVFQLRP